MKHKFYCIMLLITFVLSVFDGSTHACTDEMWTVYSNGTCAGPGVCDTAGNPGSYLTMSPPGSCFY
jgi:hypothetical protein